MKKIKICMHQNGNVMKIVSSDREKIESVSSRKIDHLGAAIAVVEVVVILLSVWPQINQLSV